MLTDKGYYIPKYLYKRKIEIIRNKIIKRKYGYLFYRKTVSQILPSQAKHHYLRHLQENCLSRWVLYWYTERIEWRLILRADIHHNLSLQHRILRRWKCFHIQCKTLKIKEEIAAIHFRKNYKKLLIRFYFCKWKLYMEYKVQKSEYFRFAWDFFKSKYKPEMLRPYFIRWNVFTNASRKNRVKLFEAKQFFENKLVYKMFMLIMFYTSRKKRDKEINENVIKFYEKNLKQKVLSTWILFTKKKQQKALNLVLAEMHYCYKLKSNYFAQLLKNKNRNCRINHIFQRLHNLQCNKLKMVYFEKFQKYVQYRLTKKEKIFQAVIWFEEHLKKKILNYWNLYAYHCQESRRKQQQSLQIAISHLNTNKIKFAFDKWNLLRLSRIKKRNKISTAACFYAKSISRNSFKIWVQYVNYKKERKLLKTTATGLYNRNLMKVSLKTWKAYVIEENNFKQKLQQAKDYYQQNIISEGLLLIIKAGLDKKEENLRNSKEKFNHQLFLAQKFLSIWKQNTLYKNVDRMDVDVSKETCFEENKENIPQVSNFEWYQICFLTPRVPKNYLKEHFENS